MKEETILEILKIYTTLPPEIKEKIAHKIIEQYDKEEETYIPCPICKGTGVNHYGDNNPCLNCNGSAVIKYRD
jgi:hypothetical protein